LVRVEFRNVSKSYDGRTVVADFSLTVEQSERLVMVGPSGCGKTTVLRMLAGFTAPDAGDILIDGKTVSTDGRILKEPDERNIGMVFQDLALWPHLTVKQNLEFGLKVRGVRRDARERRVRELLELFHMENHIHSKPSRLSGGEQQRTALARALVLDPGIMLMDEPLSSLDFELSVHLRNEITRIQEKAGFTLLYVTHDLEEAFGIGHRVVVMKDGGISMIGTSSEAKRYFDGLLGRNAGR